MNLAGADLYLLNRVIGPMAWFIERRTGVNNFAQARWLTRASAVAACVWVTMVAGNLSSVVMLWLGALIWLLLCRAVMRRIRQEERTAQSNPAMHAWLAGAMAGSRLMLLIAYSSTDAVVIAIGLEGGDYHGWRLIAIALRFHATLLGIANYLLALPPAPPRKERRKRDWLAFLRPAPSPA